jgi:hypothetical protein
MGRRIGLFSAVFLRLPIDAAWRAWTPGTLRKRRMENQESLRRSPCQAGSTCI